MNPNISREIPKTSKTSSSRPIWINQTLDNSSVGYRHTYDPSSIAVSTLLEKNPKQLNQSIENLGGSKLAGFRPSVYSITGQREENSSLSRSRILSVKKFVPIFEGKPDSLSQSSGFKEVLLYKELNYDIINGKQQGSGKDFTDLYDPKYTKSVVYLDSKNGAPSKQKLSEQNTNGLYAKHLISKTTLNKSSVAQSQRHTNIYSSANFNPSLKARALKTLNSKDVTSEVEQEYFTIEGKTRAVQRYDYNGGSLNEYYTSQVYPKGFLSSIVRESGSGNAQMKMTDSVNFNSQSKPSLSNFQKLDLKSKTALKAKAKDSSKFAISKNQNETTPKTNGFLKKESNSSNLRELLQAKKEKRASVMESTDFAQQSPKIDAQIASELLLSSHSIEHKSESQLSKNEYGFETSFDVNKKSTLLGHDYALSEFQNSRVYFNGFVHESDSYKPTIHREVQNFAIYKKNAPENILDQPSAIFKEQLLELSTLGTQISRDHISSTEERIGQFLLGVEVERLLQMMYAMHQTEDDEQIEQEDRIREDKED